MRIPKTAGAVLGLTTLFWLGCGGETGGPTGPRSPSAPPTSPLTPPVEQPAVASIDIAPANLAFDAIDATLQVSATAKDADGKVISGIAFDWSSSRPEVVTIEANGIARARMAGEAKITATASGIAASVDAVVSQVVASITVTPESQNIHKVGVTFRLSAAARDANGHAVESPSLVWTSADEAVATVDAGGLLTTTGEGTTQVTAVADEQIGAAEISVATVVFESVDPFLATPAAGHLAEVPVLIIRYLPTADGINLDVAKSPDFWSLGEVSLQGMRNRIDVFNRRIKFMLEEGSRFRGYKDPSAPPSLGYRVVDHITVYEHEPAGKVIGTSVKGSPIFLPDHHAIFERLGVRDYVEGGGVKEIWIWQTHFDDGFPSFDPSIHDLADLRGLWESNMSSPTTGDISNSDRDPTDLPIYNQTYIVYGYNIRRTQAEAIHNHGHQLEAMLSHVNALQDWNVDLFWKKFVGQDASGFVTGRAGWTHMPPNTTDHYDYTNQTAVASDIEDWTPDSSGQQTMVSQATWGGQTYDWPAGLVDELNGNAETFIWQQIESQWYIYWMQNMPGHQNGIRHSGSDEMTNWWSFTADWDGSITSQLGLHDPPGYLAASTVASLPAASNATRIHWDQEHIRRR